MPPYLEEQIAGRSWGVGRRTPGQSHFSESVTAARRTLILSVIAVALLVSRSTAVSPMREVRRVLIINDLGIISSPGFSEVDQAVLTSLQKSPYRIELYEESLDLTLFPDRVSQDRLRGEIIQKYSARKPDVIWMEVRHDHLGEALPIQWSAQYGLPGRSAGVGPQSCV